LRAALTGLEKEEESNYEAQYGKMTDTAELSAHHAEAETVMKNIALGTALLENLIFFLQILLN
jgi:hypothetical protein